MSIILDALRRGRGRKTPLPNSDAATTDAVLHTLGYGRSNSNTPLNPLKRVLGFLALGIITGIVLWGTVIWITQTYFTPAPSDVQDESPATPPSQSDADPAPPAIAR